MLLTLRIYGVCFCHVRAQDLPHFELSTNPYSRFTGVNYKFYLLVFAVTGAALVVGARTVILGATVSGLVHTPQLILQLICINAGFAAHSPFVAQNGQRVSSSLQTYPGQAPLSMKMSSRAVSE